MSENNGLGPAGLRLVNERVRLYLARLDEALVRLPDDDAAELRAQIHEHLDDAIEPGLSDHAVGQILERLGTPDALVDEALGLKVRRHRLRWPRWRLVRVRTWVAVVVALALLGSGIGYVVDMATQPGLQYGGGTSGWVSPIDNRRQHDISDLTGDESLAPARTGHWQGLVFEVENPSRWPETIVGVEADSYAAVLVTSEDHRVRLAVETNSPDPSEDPDAATFAATATVPPGQYRFVRFTWVPSRCLYYKGSTRGISTLLLRVKVGWFTHTQTVQLPETYALKGTATSSKGCS